MLSSAPPPPPTPPAGASKPDRCRFISITQVSKPVISTSHPPTLRDHHTTLPPQPSIPTTSQLYPNYIPTTSPFTLPPPPPLHPTQEASRR